MASFVRRKPLLAAGLSLGARYVIGDSFTQLAVEDKKEVDVRRVVCFGTFGALMGAGPIYWWMGYAMPKLVSPHLNSTASKCAAYCFGDVCVFMPLIYFPCFYSLREFIYHGDKPSVEDGAPMSTHPDLLLTSAMDKMKGGFVSDMQSAAMFMAPQDCLMQTLVPPHMRVPFLSVTGLVWVYLLSSSRGSEKLEEEAELVTDTLGLKRQMSKVA
mmetsp:Transcript_10012/g.14866  ORF Transcript_10012/g.14866 Transcript_10012/m.14866 type:complete len:214 (-) Transcript_10012:98-739(-)